MNYSNNNDIKLLQSLLKRPNTTDNNGNTPLHIAAKLGDFNTVELLLKHGAIPEIRNNHDDTPIDLAKQHEVLPDKTISWNHVFTYRYIVSAHNI